MAPIGVFFILLEPIGADHLVPTAALSNFSGITDIVALTRALLFARAWSFLSHARKHLVR